MGFWEDEAADMLDRGFFFTKSTVLEKLHFLLRGTDENRTKWPLPKTKRDNSSMLINFKKSKYLENYWPDIGKIISPWLILLISWPLLKHHQQVKISLWPTLWLMERYLKNWLPSLQWHLTCKLAQCVKDFTFFFSRDGSVDQLVGPDWSISATSR